MANRLQLGLHGGKRAENADLIALWMQKEPVSGSTKTGFARNILERLNGFTTNTLLGT